MSDRKVLHAKDAAKYIFLILTILWVVFIYTRSSKPAVQSDGESERMLGTLWGTIRTIFKGADYHAWTAIIRKIAHFTEYAVLGVLASITVLLRKKPVAKPLWLIPAFGGLLTALCDETIQLFVEGRSGSVADVWLDFSAIIVSTTVVFAMAWFIQRTKRKKADG